MNTVTVKTEFEFTSTVVSDLFCSAIEGGSTYWCEKIRPLPPFKNWKEQALANGVKKGSLSSIGDKTIFPSDAMEFGFILWHGGEQVEVTPEMIHNACRDFPTKSPNVFADVVDDNADACTGDVFLQLCALGEVVYC